MMMKFINMKKIISSLGVALIVVAAKAQVVSVNDAVDVALKNNPGIRAAENSVAAQRQLKRTSIDLPKTDVILMGGQYNSYETADKNISVVQSIPFTVFGGQRALNRANLASTELKKVESENELVYRVKQVHYQLTYLKARRKLLIQQDSLFEGFYKSASLRLKAGETNLLEQTTAESQRNESKNALFQAESDILVLREQLKALLNSAELPDTQTDDLTAISSAVVPDTSALRSNPALASARQRVAVAAAERQLSSARFAPDLLIGYFNQTLIGTVDPSFSNYATNSDRFTGYQVGVSLPLWFVPHQARVRAAKYNMLAAQRHYENQVLETNANFQQAIRELEKNQRSLDYYERTGIPNAQLIIKQSKTAFREGEANYMEYLLGLRNAISIQENYLQTLNNFNQTIIYLEYLTGNKK